MKQEATSLVGKRMAQRYFSYKNEGDEFYVSENLETGCDILHFVAQAKELAQDLQKLMPRGTITVSIEQSWKDAQQVKGVPSTTRYESISVSPNGVVGEVERSAY